MSTLGVAISHEADPAVSETGLIVPALPGVSEPRLLAAFDACRRITRRSARNFYYGLRLTPEPRRSAVYSIYAWMRTADDHADAGGSPQERKARLDEFRNITVRALAGDIGVLDADTFWPAFAATMASYPIDHAHVHSMLDGLAEDLDHQGYATNAELDRYCYRVGSTVGLVCIAIWGLRPTADIAQARRMAEARGRAFQLTNILRDIGQDYDADPQRIYITREDLGANGLTAEELRAWSKPDACRALVLSIVRRARAFYSDSAALEAMIDPLCAPAMWGMTRIYSSLLDIIEAEPRRVVGPHRIRLSSARKGFIALSAVIRSRGGAWTS